MLFKRKRREMRQKGEERMERREEEKEEKVEREKCERDPLHHSHDTFSVSCHSSDWKFSLSLFFWIQKREWVARTCLEKIQFNISINRKFFSFFSFLPFKSRVCEWMEWIQERNEMFGGWKSIFLTMKREWNFHSWKYFLIIIYLFNFFETKWKGME